MDLWIRSQDRENLLKIDRLDIDNNKIEANFKTHYGGCDYIVIGKYRTRERALEVLDEIQKLLIEYHQSIDYKIVPIYEMPKE